MAIPELLRSFGVDPTEVLDEIGADPNLFDGPENRISFAARGRLLSRCVARTGCVHFGLLIGQRTDLEGFGLIGLLARCCPDVGTALRSFVRFYHLHARGAVVTLATEGDRAVLSYNVYQSKAESVDQMGDGAVAIMLNVLRSFCGADWKPIWVMFGHRQPEDIEPYRKCFDAPLFFNAEQYALVFSARWLSHPLPAADPELRRVLHERIEDLQARHGHDLAEQVRGVLRTAVLAGQANADRIAALFSIHSRTLNRRLNALGTNFHQLVDECRYEVSRQLLAHSDLDVAQVAEALDYADASAFTRAFRRWSGTTPARWRVAGKRRNVGLTARKRAIAPGC
jgi:AraC-like DNA-binding protein